jgi:hypothetical protein
MRVVVRPNTLELFYRSLNSNPETRQDRKMKTAPESSFGAVILGSSLLVVGNAALK